MVLVLVAVLAGLLELMVLPGLAARYQAELVLGRVKRFQTRKYVRKQL